MRGGERGARLPLSLRALAPRRRRRRRPPCDSRVQVHVVLRRELSLVLVLQDALELVNAPLHERPACIESDRRPFRHLALLLFLLGLLGLGRHFGSRGRARVETETETEGESA